MRVRAVQAITVRVVEFVIIPTNRRLHRIVMKHAHFRSSGTRNMFSDLTRSQPKKKCNHFNETNQGKMIIQYKRQATRLCRGKCGDQEQQLGDEYACCYDGKMAISVKWVTKHIVHISGHIWLLLYHHIGWFVVFMLCSDEKDRLCISKSMNCIPQI